MTRQRKFRPVNEAAGPWLIRSHYWNSWHRRSSEGGACGYTTDIASAGVFGLQKAREYHDWPNGRDEAVPVCRVAAEMEARLAQMDSERAAFAANVATVRALLTPLPVDVDRVEVGA